MIARAVAEEAPPIRIGVLHSQKGTMAISETAVLKSTLMAMDEINREGGLLGRRVEAVVADGESDPTRFATEAERLITQEKVSAIFGCWTSASRKSVKPVFEKHSHLLFYPLQYEGLEQSPHIIYTGAAPNQQVIPAVSYCLENLGKRFYLVGSDYIFPRTANAIIKDQLTALGGEVVGERYLPLGGTDAASIVKDIAATRPDVILNTINGDSNVAFFTALRGAGITPKDIPTLSFSIGETELQHLASHGMAGDYAAWNYFQSLQTPENKEFVEAFQRTAGKDAVTSDPVEAAYFGVHLWAQAVRDAGSTEPEAVRKAIRGQGFAAPEGLVYIDGETQHTWKTVRIGRIREDGQFDVVWESRKPVRPLPYPIFRTKREWENHLSELQKAWNGQWANPKAGGEP
jgi:urea transport system substrate-binding protein